MGTHLRYCYTTAGIKCKEIRHAQKVVKDLGITYSHSTPQSMADQFWFWNCENIPNELPEYLRHLELDPMECIGYGLSEKEAREIKNDC